MQVRDRIKEFRRILAAQLRPSPRNWKLHPQSQANALRGILAEIGLADVCLVFINERDEFELIDGHLRAETLPNQELPCLILDVNRTEAAQLLAVMDPLVGMATVDIPKLKVLLADVKFESPDVSDMLARLATDVGVIAPTFPAASLGEQGRLDRKGRVKCPACGHEW